MILGSKHVGEIFNILI